MEFLRHMSAILAMFVQAERRSQKGNAELSAAKEPTAFWVPSFSNQTTTKAGTINSATQPTVSNHEAQCVTITTLHGQKKLGMYSVYLVMQINANFNTDILKHSFNLSIYDL